MTIWLYCICRNERVIMPYLLRHYRTFVDKMIFYDDQSDDGTREIIAADPKAELREWPDKGGLRDDTFMDFANIQFREARGQADWVIWIDADEFIYHPHILKVLSDYLAQGIKIPLVEAYGMVSHQLPVGSGQIYDEIQCGFRSPEWDKQEVIQPCTELLWGVGRHNIILSEHEKQFKGKTADLKLLHYRYLGLDYFKQRCLRNFARQPDYCKARSYGDNNFPDATKTYSIHWYKTIQHQTFPKVI